MYDIYACQLIDQIPDLPDIDRDACRRALSAAYFYAVCSKLGIQRDEFSQEDLQKIRLILRGLGDALESVAVFDVLHGVERSQEERTASAFVAAEALALLAKLPSDSETLTSPDVLMQESTYVALESALLYMIGGYDINAVAVVRDIEIQPIEPVDDLFRQARLTNAVYLVNRIIALCNGQVRHLEIEGQVERLSVGISSSVIYETLVDEIRARFYVRIADAIGAYLSWLGGYQAQGYEEALKILNHVREVFVHSKRPEYNAVFGDINHLACLLSAAITTTARHALLYNVPFPIEGFAEVIQNFRGYLQYRARGGDKFSGRPFLWPSTQEYVEQCLPGPQKDAVIAMPTGSGKSFLAELAVAHALCRGWVLYLAPTNALTHQIQRDLKQALFPFGSVSVRAFIGADEYTLLGEEQLTLEDQHFVAVMTPEKCALAMRLYPERFAECSLCVFDECHLLNDPNRGVTADILIAQLCHFAPNIRFLLMSAMISNPEELAEWLRQAHGEISAALLLKWRPSRTLRGLLVIDQVALQEGYIQAREKLIQLRQRQPKRVNQKFDALLALIAGLSGPWQKDAIDYRIERLPIRFTATASYNKETGGIQQEFDSWKNTAARFQAELLVKSGIPTICFILTSRHHAFSGADKITEMLPGAVGELNDLPSLVEAWLKISDAELGVETALRQLLKKGVAVHTSAMLQTEQAASEWMFAERQALLMFATPTLAQGLNLPAIGVVIAGTKMGDPRDVDKVDGVSHADTLILNGFGRAGRPGFSNQGVAILVSDSPFPVQIVPNLDVSSALDKYPVLGENDAAVDVRSPIGKFFDRILEGEPLDQTATPTELTLTALLAEYDSEDYNTHHVLSRTFAAYQNRQRLSLEIMEHISGRVLELKQEFLERPQVPEWINQAAMKAGVSFFRAWHIWLAYQQHGVVPAERANELTVTDWLDVFFNVMTLLPPCDVQRYFADDDVKRENVLTTLRDLARKHEEFNSVPWDIPKVWMNAWQTLKQLVLTYMQGRTYAEIAHVYLNIPIEENISGSRKSGDIPAVFGFLKKVAEPLAIDAGCLVAIQELGVHETVPDALQALPLCIRNGCDSLGVLSWYRFGYRERVCAHAFQSVFPLPDELTEDSARARWIRQTRKAWLSGEIQTSDNSILEYAKIVIQEGGEI